MRLHCRLGWGFLLSGFLWMLVLAHVRIVHAGFIVSMEPESSATWPAGHGAGGFTSVTDDPRGPFFGKSVHFRGFRQGGSTEKMGNLHLAYRARIDFDDEVVLDTIQVTGAGHQGAGAVLRLLDENKIELATTPLTGFNVLRTHTLDAQGVRGRTFFLDEFDHSTTWRYREAIDLGFTPVPEPSSFAFVVTLLGLNWIAFVRLSTPSAGYRHSRIC